MEDRERTLVVFLSMHRCGSSLTASALQRLGMSLGPFELNGALPSNAHGHFEAIPFLQLNRKIQELALGFPDDLPTSAELLARFRKNQGEWPEGFAIPDELLEEGRCLVRTLIESGEVSGFKDPRTVLTWPFWERVFKDFPGLRVVPVSLLRSPHEIAMSLVTRRNGWYGYWAALDIVAVHLLRQKAILANWDSRPPGLCFGSPSYFETLAEVTRQCGLTWDKEKALKAFDQSCVHQTPAAVPHEAQELFESMYHDPTPRRHPEQDRLQLLKDARFLEAFRLPQWQSIHRQLSETQEQGRQAQVRADEAGRQVQEVEARLTEARLQLIAIQQELIEHEQSRNEWQERIIQSQVRAIESQAREIQSQARQIESQARAIEAQAREIDAQTREIEVRRDDEALRRRIDRFESHPLLGPALRVRRGMRKMMHTVPESATNAQVQLGP
jgi:hypothetical protein